MNIAVLIVCLCALCSNLFVLGAWCGFKHKQRKTSAQKKMYTEAEILEIKREQQELENFMNYTGKPQEAING